MKLQKSKKTLGIDTIKKLIKNHTFDKHNVAIKEFKELLLEDLEKMKKMND